MVPENIANILHGLAKNTERLTLLLREEAKSLHSENDKAIVLANTIIRKALVRAIQESLDGNTCCECDLGEELRREENTVPAKKIAVKMLEKLGFRIILHCSHATYDSRENKKMALNCDMSMIKCEPKLYLYWWQ